jgi:hypothetical protein
MWLIFLMNIMDTIQKSLKDNVDIGMDGSSLKYIKR